MKSETHGNPVKRIEARMTTDMIPVISGNKEINYSPTDKGERE